MKEQLFTRKQLWGLVVPLILEQLLMAAIGMFDVVMVSGLGEEAISAVSLVDFISQLVNSVLTAISTGGAIVCSQYIGRGDEQKSGEAVSHQVLLVVLAGIIMAAVALAGHVRILRLVYGAIAPEVMSQAGVYFFLSGISYLFVALFCCSAAILRTLGNTKLSFHISLLMNLMNISLNALFIFGFGWGVFGAGLASLLSRMVFGFYMFSRIFDGQHLLRIPKLTCWRLNSHMTAAILRFAVPTGLESSVFYVGRLLVQVVVTGFGTSAIAANAVGLAVAEILHMPGAGIGIAMITVIGRCIGANEKEQAKRYAKQMIGVTYLLQGICCVVSVMLAPAIASLYHLTDQTKECMVLLLATHSIICTVFWPMGFTTSNALKAAGDVRFTMVVSIASMWCFRVGGSYLLVWYFPELGVLNVWFAMYLDWIARAFIYFLRIRGTAWLEKSVFL